jgi:hypothetical protein
MNAAGEQRGIVIDAGPEQHHYNEIVMNGKLRTPVYFFI